MPRKPRLENPGGFFHVAARAVDNATLFPATDDRHDFISLLYQTLAGFEWRCQSYCLMGTHVHLLVQPLTATLSRGMQALCSKHAMRVNRRYGRRGHLFGTRFMSVPIETDSHLLEAHRYIARNPVAAGLCDRPAAWRWSSYRGVVAVEPAFGSSTSTACSGCSTIGRRSRVTSSGATSRTREISHACTSWPKPTGSDPGHRGAWGRLRACTTPRC